MNHKLTSSIIALLVVPPLLWAGNAVVGRMVNDLLPPATLNFFRWLIAFCILLPAGFRIYRRGSLFWRNWHRYAVLGLLGVGMYNTLQYLALRSSTPINVTLVAASMPVWMLLIGRLFFSAPISRSAVMGVLVSISGVLLVLSRGDLTHLMGLRLVLGDLLMLVAAIAWSLYSWLLMHGNDGDLRDHWATFLLAQVSFGVLWSGMFALAEWTLTTPVIHWNFALAAALVFVAVGPALIAFRCWGAGVRQVGPNVAAFFSNLTPLFAALLSALFLGDTPQLFHAAAFVLIVTGIFLSSRRN
ncbi:DMT family transporter [Undibacterium oligocarboniphilum]|uniref:DMT family transporter n=1 Tax=Undibacterium oligocarboniphilum TaxID=666702 RepID=A0A850QC39_9BURK|nr:DMT family transporter [Undibacterium oligocarboniphilum]MBC3868849.1 DMT family transporter [Undibacterium oligocarboniphilum]NVO76829.1 DMT family transporter [Undibacterium oligocarboniphilum]